MRVRPSAHLRARSVLAALALAAAITVVAPTGATADTYVVGSNADSGSGSLRDAIEQANANVGVIDTITFGGAMVITPLTALPTITDPVVIDGTSGGSCASGAVGVQLVGSGGVGVGFDITAGGSTVRGLALDNFSGAAILLRNSPGGNVVECNEIGVSSTILQGYGVQVQASPSNVIGGSTPASGNAISGSVSGVDVSFASSTGNVVEGNAFGTDGAGGLGTSNFVAVAAAGTGTTVVGNHIVGVATLDSSAIGILADGASGVTIDGNLIGTGPTGASALGALTQGIQLNQATGAVVRDNVIAGATDTGVMVAASSSAVIQGNRVGTDATGTSGIGNRLGVIIQNAPDTLLGGPDPGDGNVVAASAELGISISGASSGTTIEGNAIGTDAGGTVDLGNGVDGIQVQGSVAALAIEIHDNLIANNDQNGISVYGTGTTATITENSMFDNSRLAWDLANNGQVDANDPLDADAGPNGHQNFPVVTSVVNGASTTVKGTLSSAAGGTYRIEAFANDACDAPYGHGEAKRFLGATTMTTDGAGNGTFTLVGSASTSAEVITTTATDAAGNTSELSSCLEIPTGVQYDWTGFYRPIDNPDIVNVGKAGRTYSAKWSLTSNGEEVTSTDVVTSIVYKKVDCGYFDGDPTDMIETVSTGSTSLRYDDAAGQFVYNWDTPTTPGCYRLRVNLDDGSSHEAHFDLR